MSRSNISQHNHGANTIAHFAHYQIEDVDDSEKNDDEYETLTHPQTKKSSKKKKKKKKEKTSGIKTFDQFDIACVDFHYDPDASEEEGDVGKVGRCERNRKKKNEMSHDMSDITCPDFNYDPAPLKTRPGDGVDKRNKSYDNAYAANNNGNRSFMGSSLDDMNFALEEEENDEMISGEVLKINRFTTRASDAVTTEKRSNINFVHSSLHKSLQWMGFDRDAIDVAIKSCNVTSIKDAMRVVVWLQEHGEGLDASKASADDERENGRFEPRAVATINKEPVQARSVSASSESFSYVEVKKLCASLSDMGYSTKEIKKTVMVFRSHPKSNGIAEDYITAMLESDSDFALIDDDTATTTTSTSDTGAKSGSAVQNIPGSVSASESRPSESTREVERLCASLSDMGFSESDIHKSVEKFKNNPKQNSNAEDYITAMLESDSDLPPMDNDAAAITTNASSADDGVGDGMRSLNDAHNNSSIPFDTLRSSGNSKHSSSPVRPNAASSLRSSGGSYGSSGSIHDSVMLESMRSSGLEIFAHDIFNKSHSLSSSRRNLYSQALPKVIPESSNKGVQLGSTDNNEHMIEISPGQFEPILPGKKTWLAMKAGISISVDCILCNINLQCCPDAEYVLCPDCHVVSPLYKTFFHSNGAESPSTRNKEYHRRLSNGVPVEVKPNKYRRRLTADTPARGVGLGFKEA